MKIDVSHFLDTFFLESAEHLSTIESGLLKLMASPSDAELLNSIFRAAHSIKGGAGAFGLSDVVKLTHALENLLDRMRNGLAKPSSDSVATMLQAVDFLKILTAHRDAESPAGMDETIAALNSAAGSSESPAVESSSASALGAAVSEQREADYKVVFQPHPDLLTTGCNPLLLLRNLSYAGTVLSTRIETKDLPSLAELETSRCYLSWEIIIRTGNPIGDLREVFEFVEELARVEITPLAGNPVIESVSARPEATGAQEKSVHESSIRVATEKIDKVIDLVGEMVIAQSMASELVENFSLDTQDRLKECLATLDRCVRELHERTLSVRMLPVGTLFSRVQRLVHDLAQKTGKKLNLLTSGEGTEVDRGVLELLADPLTHLIRNSADHGIEMPAERIALGKPEMGTISVSASHLAGSVLIEIEDDGGGLNLKRIREKAIAKGLIPPTSELSEERLRQLIFEPGFSTRSEVSDLSGRGVGMDVVKRNVTALNGTIEVFSEEGRGTYVKILLPLTLAIMDGLIVRVSDHRFVLPLISIIETVAIRPEQLLNVAGRGEAVRVRDEVIPFLRLQKMFHLEESKLERDEDMPELAVIVERGSLKAALLVDELLGQQQLVVKSLEKHFRRIEGTLGATILGDGSAGLILDVGTLIDSLAKTDRTSKENKRISLVA
jgi:two-component system chemotaxis sensor kinase CheA